LHFFIQSLLVPGVNEALTPRTFSESLTNVSFFLPVYIVSVYTFIELVIPGLLLRKRYPLFFISTAGLLLFNFIACYLSGLLYEHIVLKMPYNQISFADNKYHAIVNGGFVSVIILATAGGIKLSKKWFQKQRENEALAQQKISSELKLLKIQINPRFLFHSLLTVKNHILINSSHSPKLILQVADLLSYILYESNRKYIELEKELGIVTDYIALEEDATMENLKMEISINGAISGKYITPLILLSIVESAFEYFLEKNQTNSSSKLFIDIYDSRLDARMIYYCNDENFLESVFKLNEKFEGIRRQLKNFYADKHEFITEVNPGAIMIFLKGLPLLSSKPTDEHLQAASYSYENV
jgi:hypothetical protein